MSVIRSREQSKRAVVQPKRESKSSMVRGDGSETKKKEENTSRNDAPSVEDREASKADTQLEKIAGGKELSNMKHSIKKDRKDFRWRKRTISTDGSLAKKKKGVPYED